VIAYKKVHARNASECCSLCDGDPNCGHWVFFDSSRSSPCHLKKGGLAKLNQHKSALRGAGHTPAPPSPPPMPPTPPAPAPPGAPNLLLLFPDQWRYDWDGFHTLNTGKLPLNLPNTKAWAEHGVRFTQAYVPAPVCAPSRSCLASGREYDHTKVPSNGFDFPSDVTTFYDVLRAHGYHTMTTGKDDLTKASQLGSKTGYPGCPECRAGDGLYRQAELGFADALRYSGKMDVVKGLTPHEMYGFWLQNHTVTTESGQKTDAWQAHRACMGKGSKSLCDKLTFASEFYEDDFTASNAIALLKRRPRDRPFFLHVSFPGPHDPFLVTAAMRKSASDGRVWPEATDDPRNKTTPGGACSPTGEPDETRMRCNYAAEIENLDRLFKLVTDEVEAQGELNNTLVIITSDHGEMLGDHGDTSKSKPWQGAASVPLIIAGPGVSRGRVVEGPVANLDIVGTFLDYAGAKPSEGMSTVSLRSFLQASSSTGYRPFVSSGLDNFRMVVKEVDGISYKYICCKGQCPGSPSTAPKVSKSGWMQMLIDVQADPFDMQDLSGTKPAVVSALRALLPSESYSGDFSAGCATITNDLDAFVV